MFEPFDRNAICLCADNNYMKYLYVTLQSIVDHTSTNNIYDIVILSQGISIEKQNEAKKLENANIHINFFEINDILKNAETEFFISGHVSLATYFRFYIPDIFARYEKVVYIDCDLILQNDIYDIFSFDLGDNVLGVIYDAEGHKFDQSRIDYISNILGVNPLEYFCAGVLVYNMKKTYEFDLKKKCFDALKKIPQPMFHDQDILNAVSFKNVSFLPMTWHVQWHVAIFNDLSDSYFQNNIFYKEYIKSFGNIKILHYDSSVKPWHIPENILSRPWWKIARKTPYYEEFLYDLYKKDMHDFKDIYMKTCLFYISYFFINLNYVIYKILSKMSFGKTKQIITNKKNIYKSAKRKLNNIKNKK